MEIIKLVIGVFAVLFGIILLYRGRGGETTTIGGISFIAGLLLIWISVNNLYI